MVKARDYCPADDGAKSYLAAIEAKRLRGDDYYLRQPDDPGVDNDLEPVARPFDWRLIISLCLLQLAVMGAVAWWLI